MEKKLFRTNIHVSIRMLCNWEKVQTNFLAPECIQLLGKDYVKMFLKEIRYVYFVNLNLSLKLNIS